MIRHEVLSPRRVNWASLLNLFAGLWLIVSTSLFGLRFDNASAWNAIAAGLLISLVSIFRLTAGPDWAWSSWFNVVLGGWMIASLWIFHYTNDAAAAWNSAVVGAIVLVLGCVSETAPEAAPGEAEYYHPTPGWDYPYYAEASEPGQPPVWYAPVSGVPAPGPPEEETTARGLRLWRSASRS